MGSSKARLDWHGSTLLRRVTGIVARSARGPVVVVSSPGQMLPALDPRVEVVVDEREGRGPLQGLAAGLAAIVDRAAVAYVSSTDVPLLHPALVRLVLGALDAEIDIALPDIDGHPQPLAAAYRVDLLATVEGLLVSDRLALTALLKHCRVRRLSVHEMLSSAELSRLDPGLESVRNLNDRAAYERARALPAPEIRLGGLTVRVWTLGAAADAAGVALDQRVAATLNGERVAPDRELPLVAGDTVAFSRALDREPRGPDQRAGEPPRRAHPPARPTD
jgi:molybdenum cofactor guanylyltransferase